MATNLKSMGVRCDPATGFVDYFWLTPVDNIETVPPITDDLDNTSAVSPIYLSHVGSIVFKSTVVTGKKFVKWTPKKTTCQLSHSLKTGDTDFWENKVVGMMANDNARARSILSRTFPGCTEFAVIAVYDQGNSMVLIGNTHGGMRFGKVDITTAKRGADIELMSESSALPAMYTGTIEE
jgi:hypothetical protein